MEDYDIPELEPNIGDTYEYKPLIRDEIIFIHPSNRITSEVMTKFEYTEVLSIRSKQIEKGGTCFTDSEGISDPLELARKEIIDKKCPLDIIRPLVGQKIYEKWHVNEMVIPPDY